MKLDKSLLKKIIKESLEEAKYGHLESIPGEGKKADVGDIPPEEWEQAFEKGPDPVPEQDIAAYFKQVGEELKNRIEKLKNTPKAEMPNILSAEQLADAMSEMRKVQNDLQDINKALEDAKRSLSNKKQ